MDSRLGDVLVCVIAIAVLGALAYGSDVAVAPRYLLGAAIVGGAIFALDHSIDGYGAAKWVLVGSFVVAFVTLGDSTAYALTIALCTGGVVVAVGWIALERGGLTDRLRP